MHEKFHKNKFFLLDLSECLLIISKRIKLRSWGWSSIEENSLLITKYQKNVSILLVLENAWKNTKKWLKTALIFLDNPNFNIIFLLKYCKNSAILLP